MGRLESESESGDTKTAVWDVSRPAKMVTFSMATRVFEESLQADDAPTVTTFGSLDGYLTRARIRRVGRDVSSSLAYFQARFAVELDNETIYTTLIPASHGQAFDGFLHIGDLSTVKARTGVMERFRAHEAAHEWWGHIVGWASYRDQWLSESFAEYSAMLYLSATLENGEDLLEEMLQVYGDELLGSIKSSFSGFTRPGLPLLNRSAAHRIGPIAHGYRSSTSDAPTAYLSLVYRKGALVLNMLRVLLRDSTGSDEAFFSVLNEFLSEFRDGNPSTEDLQTVLESQVSGSWGWFFDQWIRRAEIPTYSWAHESTKLEGDDGFLVRLEVSQKGVPEDFRMPVPVEIELADGAVHRSTVLVDRPEQIFEITVPSKPRSVVFNPGHAVLARAKSR